MCDMLSQRRGRTAWRRLGSRTAEQQIRVVQGACDYKRNNPEQAVLTAFGKSPKALSDRACGGVEGGWSGFEAV